VNQRKDAHSGSDYQIGYRKPPRNTRFKPGQSGNPKGRPRGSKNLITLIDEELSSKVAVTEGGKRRVLPKRVVIVKQLVKKATEGDLRTLLVLLKLLELAPTDPASSASSRQTPAWTKDDQAILDEFKADLLESLRDVGTDAGSERPQSPEAGNDEL
jgi:hypothetical protein